jgi:hypothetical protein
LPGLAVSGTAYPGRLLRLLALLITLPLFALVNIIAKQALELYGVVSAGLKSDLVWQQISGKWNFLKASLEHLGLPLPEQANLEQVVQTILSRVSQFMYTNTIARRLSANTSYTYPHYHRWTYEEYGKQHRNH